MGPGKILQVVWDWFTKPEPDPIGDALARTDLLPEERKRLIEQDEADRLAW